MRKCCLTVVLSLYAATAHAAGPAVLETSHYAFYRGADPCPIDFSALASAREKHYARIVSFLEGVPPSPRIDYYVYPSFESKGLATGDTRLSHVNPARNEAHAVINGWIRGDDATTEASLLVRNHLGEPVTHALEIGLVCYLSEGWQNRGYEYWAVRLFESRNTPKLGDLLDNGLLAAESHLVASALAASFIAFAIEKYGKAELFAKYESWRPSGPAEIARLEHEWHAHLLARAPAHAETISRDRSTFPRPTGFQKGFCHAHEGYRILDGYLSRNSDDALAKLASLGTNAVSVTPFTYMRHPNRPVRFRFSQSAGEENDEGVIHAANTAHRLGMSVMLKPHIWLGRHWPGDIEMTGADDWDRFFENYERWIRHYALLAEIHRIELLCVGAELAKATVGQERRWRDMINRIRRLYSGQITYAANWGEEFERVDFWDALDFMGINCYYPLSDLDGPNLDDLKAGARANFEAIKRIHEAYDKPVLITEIGFTSTDAPWKRPFESNRRRPVNVNSQAMCYEAVLATLRGESWCRGIYWWKWPSFLEYGGARSSGFTPNAKPAQKIVEKWYSLEW